MSPDVWLSAEVVDHLPLVYFLSGALAFTTILVVSLAYTAQRVFKTNCCQCSGGVIIIIYICSCEFSLPDTEEQKTTSWVSVPTYYVDILIHWKTVREISYGAFTHHRTCAYPRSLLQTQTSATWGWTVASWRTNELALVPGPVSADWLTQHHVTQIIQLEWLTRITSIGSSLIESRGLLGLGASVRSSKCHSICSLKQIVMAASYIQILEYFIVHCRK